MNKLCFMSRRIDDVRIIFIERHRETFQGGRRIGCRGIAGGQRISRCTEHIAVFHGGRIRDQRQVPAVSVRLLVIRLLVVTRNAIQQGLDDALQPSAAGLSAVPAVDFHSRCIYRQQAKNQHYSNRSE